MSEERKQTVVLSDSNSDEVAKFKDGVVGVFSSANSDYDLFDTTMNGRAEYFDNPKIDLKNGKLRFVNPDMVSGENSFSIGVSHVYVSNDNLIASHFTRAGKNWKLDLEQ